MLHGLPVPTPPYAEGTGLPWDVTVADAVAAIAEARARHGKHSCPAQPFSLSAMTAAMTHLLGRYEMTPGWTDHPRHVPAQIGGVARAVDACPVAYVES